MTEENMTPDGEPRRLVRASEGRIVTGVCAGLGHYTRLDPTVFRVGFAMLVIANGMGILLYIAAALLIAPANGGPAKAERVFRRTFDGDTVLAVLGALLCFGAAINLTNDWTSGDALAMVAVFVLVLFVARARGVDLAQLVRGLPKRLQGYPLDAWPAPTPPAPPYREGMVDLGRPAHMPPVPASPVSAFSMGATAPPVPPSFPSTVSVAPARRPRSRLTPLTLLATLVVAGVMVPVGMTRPASATVQVALASGLAVVAVGLVAGSWAGRTRGLAAVGALLSLALVSTTLAAEPALHGRLGDIDWRPVNVSQATRTHKVLVGTGTVDLTDMPLTPGQHVTVDARVSLGELRVRVPDTARLEVHGRARLGDITVDGHVTSGPHARVDTVLAPETRPLGAPPTIRLDLKTGLADMEVTRA